MDVNNLLRVNVDGFLIEEGRAKGNTKSKLRRDFFELAFNLG